MFRVYQINFYQKEISSVTNRNHKKKFSRPNLNFHLSSFFRLNLNFPARKVYYTSLCSESAGPDRWVAAPGQAGPHDELVREPHGRNRAQPTHQEQGQVRQI